METPLARTVPAPEPEKGLGKPAKSQGLSSTAGKASSAQSRSSLPQTSLPRTSIVANSTPKQRRAAGDASGEKSGEESKKEGSGRTPAVRKAATLASATGTRSGSSASSTGSVQRALSKPSPVASSRKETSSAESSSGGGGLRRAPSGSSLPSPRSVSSKLRSASLTQSVDKDPMPVRKKNSAQSGRDVRFMMLPQVDVKATDELRLDLRGHRVRSLKAIKLSPNLEFVYLRDNLLSSVEGIEVLSRVKVLDLSFNDYKEPDLEPLANCKVLQQLYLAGNQITSLASLPELPNMEFLSVAQNHLKSLSMASQPRLQVLAASKNRIETFKGFPHLPVLEHLRLENNPISRTTYVEVASILLVGPTLKKFNDRDLTPSAVEVAELYPVHTAICIQDGWEVCSPDIAADSTFSFLVKQWKDQLPPGAAVKQAYVDPPYEGDPCLCHFSISLSNDCELTLEYQWFLGSKTPTRFVPIVDATDEMYLPKREEIGRYLKVECTPVCNNVRFSSIFAISSAVSPGTGIPKVLNLNISGELVEGNIIKGVANVAWCGGTPGKGIFSWLRRKSDDGPQAIVGAEKEEYQLCVDDIGLSLVLMYTPMTEEGAKGETHYAITDCVKAAAPSVSNVQIVGDAVEDNTIRGTGKYFGGREGQSKYLWLREKENGEFIFALSGTDEYTLTKKDVGRRLKFVYVPLSSEGQDGEPTSMISEVVKKAPPKVTSLKIVGDMREGSKVSALAVITNGTEGSSRVQWYKSLSPIFYGEQSLEALSSSKIAKTFRIPLGAVGHYIVVKYTAMAPDGETGEPVFAISESVIETLPPSLNFLTVTGVALEGETLTASYGYIGGHEGSSQYNWYLHESEDDINAPVLEASGHLQFCITKEAVGKFISFECTPVRDDGVMGEKRKFTGKERVRAGNPRLLSLQLDGKPIEGTSLIARKKYWGGEEGNSVFHWLQITSDGTQNEIQGAEGQSYTLTCDDIGFHIAVSCEPVRSDGVRGTMVIAESIGPVIPGMPTCESLDLHGLFMEGCKLICIAKYRGGFKGDCIHQWFRVYPDGQRIKLTATESLDLTIDDVGNCIELMFTPVRQDGQIGLTRSIVSETILPADPKGIELALPNCSQDETIVPRRIYFGGREGTGKYTWYRSREKLADSKLNKVDTSSADLIGEELTCKSSLEDVGSYLILHWVPTRDDGKVGEPLVAISNVPVMAAHPVVSEVYLEETMPHLFKGGGVYYGGHEGASLLNWYRESNEGIRQRIEGANSREYRVTESDYNCRLLFGYTAVRSDGVVGQEILSEPSKLILPEIPRIERLSIKGNEVEGEILTAVISVPETDAQNKIWAKYIKEIKYNWYYFVDTGESQSFEELLSLHSCTYKLQFEDIGRCLRCECIVTGVFGQVGEPAFSLTGPIFPGLPKIDNLEIEGRGFHTNLYSVRGNYSGGREGKSKIMWLRSMVGSPDLISIPGEIGKTYEANVDDVGYRLVALYTPVREDGVEGQPVSVSTEPIAVEPDLQREVKQKLELDSVKFEVLCDKNRLALKGQALGNLEKRILQVNRNRIKVVKPGSKTSFPSTEVRGTFAPPFHVELIRNDQHRFKIVIDSDNEVDLMVQTRHMRDLVILVIRGLAHRYNSTSLNTLLKIDA